ncbi:hercynine metabolism small protein [Prochlorococcus marinus]|uniref:hercynine metabolism small protein n=1 Tax=Prochlorococcus marinus TaxID=1219 RepID=UPI0022B4CD4E|nr:hercynine metabolism small protein [Prochlorococcus marinus]
MEREEKRIKIKFQREKLIQMLEEAYQIAFNELSCLNIEEGSIAKLSQAFLLSRSEAMKPLEKEIEKPIITQSPNQKQEKS